MNVVEMLFQITIVPNDVIPEPFLPELQGLMRCKSYYLLKLASEMRLDRVHDVTEITLSRWLNNDVEMVE